LSLVAALVSESPELFGWFDAQAASHMANTTRAIVFFKKISPVLEKTPTLGQCGSDVVPQNSGKHLISRR